MISRHIEAGVHRLPRAPHHRVMVHASAATRSYCNQVGRYFVRRAGDIDLVPAGEEGAFGGRQALVSPALARDLGLKAGDSVLARLPT